MINSLICYFYHCALFSGVAVGSGWQGVVAIVNIGSYYIVGVPIGVFLGWLRFGIAVSMIIVSLALVKKNSCSKL